ncbi:hypothetical protein A1I_05975 [Rickettsia bellii OSU 85-389]|nr:hypothetical protein A1I_05975 [Rickettsia bellii OSU 85-389]
MTEKTEEDKKSEFVLSKILLDIKINSTTFDIA